MDAGDAHLSGRVGALEPRPAPRLHRRPAARLSVRLPLRQHRRRLVHREALRAAGPPLPLLARGPGDPRPGGDRRAARLRVRLPVPPRRRHRGPQLLRAAPADDHQQHRGRGPLLLGDAGRDPPGRRVRQIGQGRDPPQPHRGRRASRPHHRAHDLQRPHQPPAVPRDGAPDRELELAARHPGGPRVQPLAPDRRRRRAPSRALVRLHDGIPGRPGLSRAAARSLGRAAAQDGEGAAPSRAARQRPAERVASSRTSPTSISAFPTGRSPSGPGSPTACPGARRRAPLPPRARS